MAVDVKCEGRSAVPEPLLDHLWVNPLPKKQGSMAVPKVMEPNGRESGALHHPSKDSLGNFVSVERSAVWLAEDQTVIRVLGPQSRPHFPQQHVEVGE